MTSKSKQIQILQSFVHAYFELLDYVKNFFDKNIDFKRFYAKNLIIKRSNISLFIKTWYKYITQQYYEIIMDGNIDYFFKDDMQNSLSEQIDNSMMKYIILIRNKYKSTNDDIIKIIADKIKVLTQFSYLYFNRK